MKWIALTLLFLFCGLQSRLWHGAGSVAELRELDERIATQQVENDRLLARNAQIKFEVEDLRSGVDAIEERARHELGLVKKGEVFYRIVRN